MDHNRCRVCDVDFGTLESFDDHRAGYYISRGQDLKGKCIPPGTLDLSSRENSDGTVTYWTFDGAAKRDAFTERRKGW